ncbi:MAG: hypothetical protein LBE13_04750 [Bacteroidales bacterium]|jgi:hypothetical protein|nr:hypothetical protein [Bacteroidales bacterium]
MGTSASFNGIKNNPNWKSLSNDITRACGSGYVSQKKFDKILSEFSNLIRSSRTNNKGSGIIGNGGIRTATNLGKVLQAIKTDGFISTLSSMGFNANKYSTPHQAINFLLEYCSGVASSLDDVAAKEAERELLEELGGGAKSLQDLEQNYQEILDQYDIDEILIKYNTYYINEHLSTMFYEKLLKEKGKEATSDFYRQLKDYLLEKLKNLSKKRSLKNIDWASPEGQNTIAGIIKDTMEAFENYEY